MRPIKAAFAPLQRGFTLVEAVLVIVITGILFASIALFIRLPVQGASDTVRRAALVDAADTALQRLRRDLRAALPNSVRVNAAGTHLEFLPVVAGGRYCAEPDSGGTCSAVAGSSNDALDFWQADSSFEVVGPLVRNASFSASNTWLAVYNLGIPGADAWSLETMSPVSSISAGSPTIVNFNAHQFPFDSPGKRFHIVGAPVSYVCSSGSNAGNGTGTLLRYTGYALQSTQPTSFAGVSGRRLAGSLAGCTFDFAPAAVERDGLLTMTLQLRQQGETVSLTHAIQIHNTP